MTTFDVGIINYGLGNIKSVEQAILKIGYTPKILLSSDEICRSQRLILPGVGNFAKAKNLLDKFDWSDQIYYAVKKQKKPIFGICLGMQLLASHGYEGADEYGLDKIKGFGFIKGEIKHLSQLGCDEKIPHMGWNSVFWEENESHDILQGIKNGTDFYFVHSFAYESSNSYQINGWTNYSSNFISVVSSENVWGTQFHPEKSSSAGLKILKNFMEFSVC